jgi:hypothetical protein
MHQCTVLDSEPAPRHSRLHQACVNTQRSRITVQRSRITAQWRTGSHRAPQSVCATVQHYSYRDLSMGSVALYVSAHYCHSEPQMDQGLLMYAWITIASLLHTGKPTSHSNMVDPESSPVSTVMGCVPSVRSIWSVPNSIPMVEKIPLVLSKCLCADRCSHSRM